MAKQNKADINLTAKVDIEDIKEAGKTADAIEAKLISINSLVGIIQEKTASLDAKALLLNQLQLLSEASEQCKGADGFYEPFSDRGGKETLCALTATMLDVYRQLKLDALPTCPAPTEAVRHK